MRAEPFSIPWPLPIWLWINYPAGRVPAYIDLHVAAIRRHAPRRYFNVVVLNQSTLVSYIPDLPPEYTRLPHQTAYSDFARIALLAHYGGLYLDTDFIVTKSLVPFAAHLTNVSFVGYKSSHRPDLLKDPTCAMGSTFSPNFFAARPGTSVMKAAWSSLKHSLTRRCTGVSSATKDASRTMAHDARAFVASCCYAHADGAPVTCQTPWQLSDAMLRPLLRKRSEAIYCYGGDQTFVPEIATRHPTARKYLSYMLVYGTHLGLDNCNFADIDRTNKWAVNHPNSSTVVCCERIGVDLECSFLWRADARRRRYADSNVTLRTTGFFDRVAYHVFSSINRRVLMQDRESLLESRTVYGSLVRQSLGLEQRVDGAKPRRRSRLVSGFRTS